MYKDGNVRRYFVVVVFMVLEMGLECVFVCMWMRVCECVSVCECDCICMCEIVLIFYGYELFCFILFLYWW